LTARSRGVLGEDAEESTAPRIVFLPAHAGGCSAPEPEAYPFGIPSRRSLVGQAVRISGPTGRGMSDGKRRGVTSAEQQRRSPRLAGCRVDLVASLKEGDGGHDCRPSLWLDDRRSFASSKAPDRGGSRGRLANGTGRRATCQAAAFCLEAPEREPK